MTDYSVIEATETPYLYVERRCRRDPAEIGPAMGSGLGEVWRFMESHGIAPVGGAVAVYHDYSPDEMTFRTGFIVTRADLAKAAGDVKGAVTPAGRTVYGRHTGSYSGIPAAYGDMHRFVQAEGLRFTAPTWEVYPNSPEEVPEEELITDLFQALEP